VLHLKDDLLHRGVNEGFSGGEKKRNEIFQLAVLEPKLAILDETDSGLDIDALRNVADGVNALRSPDRAFLVITHYQRLLDYIKPDVVHVLSDGASSKPAGRSWRSNSSSTAMPGLPIARRRRPRPDERVAGNRWRRASRATRETRATLDAVLREGLPKPRSELWKYTSLRALERADVRAGQGLPAQGAPIEAGVARRIDGAADRVRQRSVRCAGLAPGSAALLA
jgi:energy-coupling factor transporter ATP-binding protein EcfA2